MAIIALAMLCGMISSVIQFNRSIDQKTHLISRRIRNNKFTRIKSNYRQNWLWLRLERKRKLRWKKPRPLYHLTTLGQVHMLSFIIYIEMEFQLAQAMRCIRGAIQLISHNNIMKQEVASYIEVMRVATYWLFSESIVN